MISGSTVFTVSSGLLLLTLVQCRPDVSHLAGQFQGYLPPYSEQASAGGASYSGGAVAPQTLAPELHDDQSGVHDHEHHHHHGEDGHYDPDDDGTGWDIRLSVPGEPERDYPTFDAIPKTNFDCQGKHAGYYADVEARCQSFHVCMNGPGRGIDFLCPNGTLFNQEVLACDWWMNVECAASDKYFFKNEEVGALSSGAALMEEVMQMLMHPIANPPAPPAYGQPSMDYHYQMMPEPKIPFPQSAPPAVNVIGMPAQNTYDSSTRKYYTPTIPTTQQHSSSGGQASYTGAQQEQQFGQKIPKFNSQQNSFNAQSQGQFNTQQSFNVNPNQYQNQKQTFNTGPAPAAKPANQGYNYKQNTVTSNAQQKYTYPSSKSPGGQLNVASGSSGTSQGTFSTVSPIIQVPSRTFSLPKLSPTTESLGSSTSTDESTNEPDINIRFGSSTTDDNLSENNQNNLSGTFTTYNSLNKQTDETQSSTTIPYTNGDSEQSLPSSANDNSAFNTQSSAVDLTLRSQLGNSPVPTTESGLEFMSTTQATTTGVSSNIAFSTEVNKNIQEVDLSIRLAEATPATQAACSSSTGADGCSSTSQPKIESSTIIQDTFRSTTPAEVDVRIDTSSDVASVGANSNTVDQFSIRSEDNSKNTLPSSTLMQESSSLSDTEYNYPVPSISLSTPQPQPTQSIGSTANISNLEYLPPLQINNAVEEAPQQNIPNVAPYPTSDVSSINDLLTKIDDQSTKIVNKENDNTQNIITSNDSNSFNSNEGENSFSTIIQSSTSAPITSSSQTTSAEDVQSNNINIRFDGSNPDTVLNFTPNQQGSQNQQTQTNQQDAAIKKPAAAQATGSMIQQQQYQQQAPTTKPAVKPFVATQIATSQGGSFSTSHYSDNFSATQFQKQKFNSQNSAQFNQQSSFASGQNYNFGASSASSGSLSSSAGQVQFNAGQSQQQKRPQYTSGQTSTQAQLNTQQSQPQQRPQYSSGQSAGGQSQFNAIQQQQQRPQYTSGQAVVSSAGQTQFHSQQSQQQQRPQYTSGQTSVSSGAQVELDSTQQPQQQSQFSGETIVEFVPALGFSLDLENERQGYIDAVKNGLFHVSAENIDFEQFNAGSLDFSNSQAFISSQFGSSGTQSAEYTGPTSYQSPISSIGSLNDAGTKKFNGYSRNKPNVPFSF